METCNIDRKLKQGGFISAFLKFGFLFDELNSISNNINYSISDFIRSNKSSEDPSFKKFIESSDITKYLPSGAGLMSTLKKKQLTIEYKSNNRLPIIISSIWNEKGFHKTYEYYIDNVLKEKYESANQRCENFGNFSNTCMFRNFNIESRRISIINKRLKTSDHKMFSTITQDFTKLINFMYYIMFLRKNKEFEKSIVGFISGKSYIEHAKVHLGCRSAISIDISKFYDNTTLYNIISKGLFYRVLCYGFENITGVQFKIENFENEKHFHMFNKMFGVMNLQFITLMNFFSHNGRLPTGMPYSPVISNLLFAPIDMEILKNIDNSKIYSRYADDICISTKEEKDQDGNFTISINDAKEIENLIGNNGYHLKYSKTKIMGPRDKKVIAGIILGDSAEGQKLSIGTQRKIQLAEEYKNKCWNTHLSSHDKGVLEWVRNINFSQYSFIIRDIVNVPDNKKLPVVIKDRKTDSIYLDENRNNIVAKYKTMLSR